ncbi:hypothetical protein [uncultured Anaerococcus sp.]|uniref:hypothetical protein n=1 Tax=uncultured Anaerococcus sp. TaxID=293428 RepID=UPI0025D3F903|nr:hypothetical protein [uncultured Anaerococcus sp.]
MANENGNSKLNNCIANLKDHISKIPPESTIVDNILEAAYQANCKVIRLKKSIYIKKGLGPKAIFHLNIDNPTDISYNFSSIDEEAAIVSNTAVNLMASSLIITYLITSSSLEFDVLVTYSNIQSKFEEYEQLREILRTDKVINLNLRQADCLADEFSSLLLSLVTVPIERFDADFDYKTYRLSLKNLMGGHAGDNINKVRMNSIKMILGIFRKMKSKVDLDMLSLTGGDRYDNIPSFAEIDFIINENYENDLLNTFEIYKNEAIEKNLRYEPDMSLICQEIEPEDISPISTESFNHLASLIELSPTGTFAVNSIDNQIISSSNLATIRSFDDSINMIQVFRSLTEEGMSQMVKKSKMAAMIAKSDFKEKLFMPSWLNSDKNLTKSFVNAYRDLFNDDLDVIKTQYSLDSSIVFRNLNVKMVSLGVKYKQEGQYFYTQINELARVIILLEKVLDKLKEDEEHV